MLPLGKKVRVDNFSLLMLTRKLSKKDVADIHFEDGSPKELEEVVKKSGYPYLVIETVAGDWKLELALPHPFFAVFNELYGEEGFSEDGEAIARYLLQLFYTDTTFLGDAAYVKEKQEALERFMQRQENGLSDEENQKILDEMEEMAGHRETLAEIVETITETEENAKNETK